ncbi:fatty acid hydroxylase family protein [Leptospira yanagawae serovar Saopaulo str. Sao Paulo = ATCC 700523]|uniref:Fatty acid hydroxylase family protein n=1 Tax=Leptospira yanagawae serovar Saopaulo str. Sao Paulo = ATCC 700523 TaxID=1249483 RepID=A0A5E8HGR5_9LEPT|nr:sterol desaturase family protein [Leptospira yanagawae]EOQ89176.1 fatty acid hydroxylase family protein [Leptospira yanagawae serovar Saopaulo str. Sao Paulo = ATCC 700523]
MRLIETIVPFYFILMLIEIIYTRYTKKDYYFYEDSIADLSLGVLSRIFDGLILLGVVFVYSKLYDLSFGVEGLNKVFLGTNSFLHWLVLFVLLDFLFYLAHRYSHEIKILWASHVVHHSSEEFNLSVALRQSFIRNIGIGMFYLPLALLGFPVESYLIIDALNRTYQFWVHTRTINKLPKWFEAIFVTPSHHRVHHAMNPEYIDKNYGGVFIVWDKLFGTFCEESFEPRYGLTSQLHQYDPIGANIHVLKDLFSDLIQTKYKWQGIVSFFSYPSVRPDDLQIAMDRGVRDPKIWLAHHKLELTQKVFNSVFRIPSGPTIYRVYLGFQFAIPTILTLYFLKRMHLFRLPEVSSVLVLLVFSFYSLGKLLEGKKEWFRVEIPKYFSWLFLLVYFFTK